MDFLIGFSGIMAAGALVWITVALFGAILIGGAVAGIFGSMFFGLSRLARAAEKRHHSAQRDA